MVRAFVRPAAGGGTRPGAAQRRARVRGRLGGMARTIATTESVDLDQLLEFIRPRHHMVLITHRRDGSPQASPVTAGVDEQGRIVISTYPERAKTANARRGPRGQRPGPVRRLRRRLGAGRRHCEVLDLPDALEPLVDYFRAISGEHPDWDEYREAMRAQGKSLLRITPTRWGPVATGGFPARLADA